MFITFEGIEGCGKTTQIRRLAAKLEKEGRPVLLTFEPGATEIGKRIRRILLDSKNTHLSPLTELLLYEADRAQHVAEIIRPALEAGQLILCDRFYDATVVYQGMARGQDRDLIRLLNEKAADNIKPDLTFLLDCTVEVGLARALKRNNSLELNEQARFEREKKAFHHKVREGYLTQAREFLERFAIIDATLSPEQVEENIWRKMETLLTKETRDNAS